MTKTLLGVAIFVLTVFASVEFVTLLPRIALICAGLLLLSFGAIFWVYIRTAARSNPNLTEVNSGFHEIK